jgi:hypothetical protein
MDLINSPLGFDQEVEGPGSRDSGALRADAGWLGLKFSGGSYLDPKPNGIPVPATA